MNCLYNKFGVCFSYRKHINFDTIIKRNLEEPECMTDFYSDSDVDQLPGIVNKASLNYEPETGLRGVGIICQL